MTGWLAVRRVSHRAGCKPATGPSPLRRAVAIGLVLLLPLGSCTCRRQAPEVRTRRLATLPEKLRRQSVVVADDGATFAYVESAGDQQVVVRDGAPGPRYARVTNPVFGRGGTRLAYWATDPTLGAGNQLLVVGEAKVETHFAEPGALVFSKDGSRWASAGIVAEPRDSGFAPAGAAVYADGRQVGRYRDATAPTFSPDGAHFAYIAETEPGTIALFVDGIQRRVFPNPTAPASPLLKPGDGRALGLVQLRALYLADGSLVTLAQDADGWAIYRDDKRLASFAHVVALGGQVNFNFEQFRDAATMLANSLSRADDAAVLAWWERRAGADEGWHLSRNGQPQSLQCALYWEYSPPLLSKDGSNLTYPCWRESPTHRGATVDVVVGDRRFGPYANTWGAAFSDDGRHVVYGAQTTARGSWSYYHDGHPFPLAYDEVWRPRFSPDGSRIAWEAKRGKRSVLALDGDSLYSFDDVLWGPQFPQPNVAAWVVRRGRKLMRVEARF